MTAQGNRLAVSEARPQDLAELARLYLHLNPLDPVVDQTAAEARLHQLQAYPGSCVLVGRVGHQLAASCTLVVIPNLTRAGAPYALIENVVTDAVFRGRGYGTTMLHAARDRAFAANCYKVMLLTGSKEPATLRFYEKAGFEQTKTGFQKRMPPASPG